MHAMETPASPQPLLLLVDGSSYLYRAYHAMPDLRSPQGLPTGAIHGFIAMMKRLREQVLGAGGHGHAACVFDAPGPTFRDEWYPEYKAHRAPMPDAIRSRQNARFDDPRHVEIGGDEFVGQFGALLRHAAGEGVAGELRVDPLVVAPHAALAALDECRDLRHGLVRNAGQRAVPITVPPRCRIPLVSCQVMRRMASPPSTMP